MPTQGLTCQTNLAYENKPAPAIQNGKLPSHAPDRTWGGPGTCTSPAVTLGAARASARPDSLRQPAPSLLANPGAARSTRDAPLSARRVSGCAPTQTVLAYGCLHPDPLGWRLFKDASAMVNLAFPLPRDSYASRERPRHGGIHPPSPHSLQARGWPPATAPDTPSLGRARKRGNVRRCEESISKKELGIEGQSDEGQTLHFHVRCFSMWTSERV